MIKKNKLIIVSLLVGISLFASITVATAVRAVCLTNHAGFCAAIDLEAGESREIDFDDAEELLENHYNDNSVVLGYSYMEYDRGYWYWRCGNEQMIRFEGGPPAPCVETWSAWSVCTEDCGNAGTQTRTQTCTNNTERRNCNRIACPKCGTADKESFKKTSELTTPDTRCAVNNTISDWDNKFSTTDKDGGKAWTWKCNRNNLDVSCEAYVEGECIEPVDIMTGPYTNESGDKVAARNSACKVGAFNSVELASTETGPILKWKCGTGYLPRSVGSFGPNKTDVINGMVPLSPPAKSGEGDFYGPRDGGVECKCKPIYQYDCVATGTTIGKCTDNCGGTVMDVYIAKKTDTACFPLEDLVITKPQYKAATGEVCANKQRDCQDCGVNSAVTGEGSDIITEIN